jgi:hypothetical protein
LEELSNLFSIFREKGYTPYMEEIIDIFEKNCNVLKE